MAKVSLHLYDVTNSSSVNTNAAVIRLNRIMRDTMGLGGIFHGAIEVYGEEWSYGFCERGSGVFSCPPKGNPMYAYRETIELGVTAQDEQKVSHALLELSAEWDGRSYDLLARNCNHFCDELSQRLGAGHIPVWVNRFALAGDAALEFAGTTAIHFQKVQNSLFEASRNAYRFVWGGSEASLPSIQKPQETSVVSGHVPIGVADATLLAARDRGSTYGSSPVSQPLFLADEREGSLRGGRPLLGVPAMRGGGVREFSERSHQKAGLWESSRQDVPQGARRVPSFEKLGKPLEKKPSGILWPPHALTTGED